MSYNSNRHIGNNKGYNSNALSRSSGFNGLPNALYEWWVNNASIVGSTMTLPDTGSIGGLDLTNPTAAQLPSFSTINGKKSVLSDGVDDILRNTTHSDFGGSDHSGVMHFVFERMIDATYQFFFVTSDGTFNNYVNFRIINTNVLNIGIVSAGVNSSITGTTAIAVGEKKIGTILSDGSTLKLYLGSNLEGSLTNAINWFGDVSGTTVGIDMLSRETVGFFYTVTSQPYGVYTPYTSVADALADQKIIADFYKITV